MANFIFDWALSALLADTLDLSTGNYYAHLVTAAPVSTNTTVANLVIPTVSGYAPTALTGLSYNANRWSFDSFNFPKYVFASAPTGVVICKRAGASPATTDQIICYSAFHNSIGQTIVLSVGTYVVDLQFGSQGAINFSYLYQYSSGAYDAAAGNLPPGLIRLIATKNNTLPFANPFNATTSLDGSGLTDGVATGGTVSGRTAFDFGSTRVRIGTFGARYTSTSSQISTTLWGSNNVPTWTAADIDNNAFWVNLGSYSVQTVGWNLITLNSSTFYRYFKIARANTVQNILGEIEFYNSSALSNTQNFV